MSSEQVEPTVSLARSDSATGDGAESTSRPVEESRERSRSPRDSSHHHKKPKRKDAGFKWKERRRDEEPERDEGLRRGYRDQYKPRDRDRERSRSRSPARRDSDRYGDRRDRHRADESYKTRDSDSRRYDKEDRERPRRDERDRERTRDNKREEKPEKKKPAAAPQMPPQEMILVTVNDRLGTKKQVPCLPSDTIKDFKAVVAMMIGRRPHEILLKRQSERPFKDFLTLQDYGISNNVQLDLEVDTGD